MSPRGYTALQMINNGNTGNRMFQYAYLKGLQRFIPRSDIFGADILDFVPRSENFKGSGNSIRIEGGHVYPFDHLAQMILNNRIKKLFFGGYVQRLEYFGSPDQARALFSLPEGASNLRFTSLTSDKYITCIVRADEVLRAVHPDYPPTPISFFRAAVEDSGRIPVLVGQTESSYYSDAIKRLFPQCLVYEHVNPVEDFRFILNSTNVAMAVSTFAWMAAYLSRSAKRIYMPAFGFLNRDQRPDVDLCPRDDARFLFADYEPFKWNGDTMQREFVLDASRPVWFRS